MSRFTALRRAARTLELWGGLSSDEIMQAAQKIADADGTDAAHVLAEIAHVFLEEMMLLVEQRD